MARKLLKDTCPLAAEILDGQHDEDLDFIAQAIKARQKSRFQKGSKVRLVNTRNPQYDGQVGTVLKVNQKTVTVGIGEVEFAEWDTRREFGTWSVGEVNAPPAMLEAVSA